MRTPIDPDLSPNMCAAFVDEQNPLGGLHDFERPRHQIDSRQTGRQTAEIEIVLFHGATAFKLCSGPGLEGNRDACTEISHMARQPHAIDCYIGSGLRLHQRGPQHDPKKLHLPTMCMELFSSSWQTFSISSMPGRQ